MVRPLLGVVVQLLANAVGLVVAAWALDDVRLSGLAFVVAVVVFTVVDAVAEPFLVQIAQRNAPALRGGVALVATLVALVVTALVSDGLSISGGLAWVEATVIVWLVSLVAALVLPLVLVRRRAEEKGR
jgi:uncharacterized membrane protein YvlD (DUF360 family)